MAWTVDWELDMPNSAHPKHHDLDAAFRHGYVQGVAVAIAALQHRFSDDERRRVETWLQYELSPWSQFEGLENMLPAPDFPNLAGSTRYRAEQSVSPVARG